MDEWYYTKNNEQKGPISWDELRQLASSGILNPTDLIWKEGLIDWQKAEKQEGLFGRSGSRARDRDDDERPRRRQRADDDYDRPRRRRQPRDGVPLGAKVAIVGGSVAIGIVILIIVIILVVRTGGPGGGIARPGVFQVTLLPNQRNIRVMHFQAGLPKHISVLSTVTHPQTDVDLVVEQVNGGQVVAIDNGFSKDCNVVFNPPVTGPYRIQIINLGPGTATCTVTMN